MVAVFVAVAVFPAVVAADDAAELVAAVDDAAELVAAVDDAADVKFDCAALHAAAADDAAAPSLFEAVLPLLASVLAWLYSVKPAATPASADAAGVLPLLAAHFACFKEY